MRACLPIVECDNIQKTYLLGTEGVAALRGVDLAVVKGEFLLVYGTSGGGKSTLLNVLGTIDTPSKGNLAMFGRRITDFTSDSILASIRCHKMGFVFQSFNLLPTMSAIENVMLPMIISGNLSRGEIRKRAISLLDDVGLGHRLNHYPSMLSGGEQQRVTIARALANDPEILLADEPTGDLDTKSTDMIMEILLDLQRKHGLTVVMVTHDVYMKQYANRILYMRDGCVNTIDIVDPLLNQRAYQRLKDKLQDEALRNVTDETQRQVAGRFLRDTSNYATAAAQIPLCDDDEMKDAVQFLFGNNPVK